MKARAVGGVLVLAALSVASGRASWTLGAEREPENLALKARVSASDQYDPHFAARFAVDGKIPEACSQDDLSQASASPCAP